MSHKEVPANLGLKGSKLTFAADGDSKLSRAELESSQENNFKSQFKNLNNYRLDSFKTGTTTNLQQKIQNLKKSQQELLKRRENFQANKLESPQYSMSEIEQQQNEASENSLYDKPYYQEEEFQTPISNPPNFHESTDNYISRLQSNSNLVINTQQNNELASSLLNDSLQLDAKHRQLFGSTRLTPTKRNQNQQYFSQNSNFQLPRKAFDSPTALTLSSPNSYQTILTNEQTLAFWRSYFSSIDSRSKVYLEIFLNRILQEYKYIFTDSLKNSSIDRLLQAIGKKVSIDGRTISLSALEIWTSKQSRGLKAAILSAVEEIEQENQNINSHIVNEVAQLRDLLEIKHKQLKKREFQVAIRERQADQREEQMRQRLQMEMEQMMKRSEQQMNVKINKEMKKLQNIERQLQNKMLVYQYKRQKQNNAMNSKIQGKNDINDVKLKSARIMTLQKSVEATRAKNKAFEEKIKIAEENNSKLQEKVDKLKSKNSLLSSKLQQRKNSNTPGKIRDSRSPQSNRGLRESQLLTSGRGGQEDVIVIPQIQTNLYRKKQSNRVPPEKEDDMINQMMTIKNRNQVELVNNLQVPKIDDMETSSLLMSSVTVIFRTLNRTVPLLFANSNILTSPNATSIQNSSFPHSPTIAKFMSVIYESSDIRQSCSSINTFDKKTYDSKSKHIFVKDDSMYSTNQPLQGSVSEDQKIELSPKRVLSSQLTSLAGKIANIPDLVDIGELLFPSFNTLIPNYFEIFSNLNRNNTQPKNQLLEVMWKSLNYAFKAFILPRRAPYWMGMRKPFQEVFDSHSNLSMLINVQDEALLQSSYQGNFVVESKRKKIKSEDQEVNVEGKQQQQQYAPFNLDFTPTTKRYKKKMDSMMHQLQNEKGNNKKGGVLISPRGSLTKPTELPIYPLFKTPLVRKIFSQQIKPSKAVQSVADTDIQPQKQKKRNNSIYSDSKKVTSSMRKGNILTKATKQQDISLPPPTKKSTKKQPKIQILSNLLNILLAKSPIKIKKSLNSLKKELGSQIFKLQKVTKIFCQLDAVGLLVSCLTYDEFAEIASSILLSLCFDQGSLDTFMQSISQSPYFEKISQRDQVKFVRYSVQLVEELNTALEKYQNNPETTFLASNLKSILHNISK